MSIRSVFGSSLAFGVTGLERIVSAALAVTTTGTNGDDRIRGTADRHDQCVGGERRGSCVPRQRHRVG